MIQPGGMIALSSSFSLFSIDAIFFPSPAVRRMLLVGIGMATIQQAVGIDAVMFYLMFVIRGSGINTELGEVSALIVLGLVKLVFVFVGANLFDQLGRRPLLFASLCGMFSFEMIGRYSLLH